MSKVLVTGSAGFIGYHVAERLLADGYEVWGLDNLNVYYDVELKRARLARLQPNARFRFVCLDIADRDGLLQLFREHAFDEVLHLAAQAGVRYALEHPEQYVNSNLAGFANVLEACRLLRPRHLVFASSSSVYGAKAQTPFRVTDTTDHPISFYAATKKANEVMAHSYAHLFGIPTTVIRFFTVYGPWGRPDMALYKFARAITSGQPIELYNFGRMERDFTYVGDVTEAVVRILRRPPHPDHEGASVGPQFGESSAPFRIYNLGHSKPEPLNRVVELLEENLGCKAQVRLLPMQPGDVPTTFADVSALERDFGFRAGTPIELGIREFARWFRSYELERGVAA